MIQGNTYAKLRRKWKDNHGRDLPEGQKVFVVDVDHYGDEACVAIFDEEGETSALFSLDTVYLEPDRVA